MDRDVGSFKETHVSWTDVEYLKGFQHISGNTWSTYIIIEERKTPVFVNISTNLVLVSKTFYLYNFEGA